MTNLIVDYQKRHKTQSIPMQHDGLCFFDPPMAGVGYPIIAMTSLSCRSFMGCAKCEEKTPSVIVELFQPGYNGSFSILHHDHVDQATDLLGHIKRHGYPSHQPYYAKKGRDLELWLWKFVTQTLRVTNARRYVETDPEMRILEQMAHQAIKYPKTYQIYYIAYEAFLLHRKYLLFE